MMDSKGQGGGASRVRGALIGLTPNHKGGQTLTGWARDGAGGLPVVDIFADGQFLMTARPARRRLRRPLTASLFGFRADLPANFCAGETVRLEAKARVGGAWAEVGRVEARLPPMGERLPGEPFPLPISVHAPDPKAVAQSRAAIVLTRDGAKVLADLLQSIVAHEPEGFRRIVIVDHASTDDTAGVVARFAESLPLEHVNQPRDGTFASSNNLAAKRCDEDVLFFVNNDIVLTEPCLDAMAGHLTADAGLVGLRLMDPPAVGGEHAAQHVGIHFCATPDGILPLESRWLTDAAAANGYPIEVPAVTAAFAAMRRETFEALGGFDERFTFGMEDVDLCLSALEAGYTNVAVNGVAAIHVASSTRRRTARLSTQRNRENASLLAEKWQARLCERIARDLFVRPGFWTGRALHVGIATGDTAISRADAEDLARRLYKTFPAKVFVLEAGGAPDARLIDALIAPPDFDMRRVTGLSGATRIATWDPRSQAAEAFVATLGRAA